MEDHPETDAEAHPDTNPDTRNSVSDRFQRVVRQFEKPKPTPLPEGFHGITIEERTKRLVAITTLVHQSFAVEQIVAFLPTWGMKLSRSQVYEYLTQLKLPRGYKRSIVEQRIHDRLAINHLVRIAEDAAVHGLKMDERIEVGKAVAGFRFKPDARFFIVPYGFMLEEQASPLPETRWTTKLKAHLHHFLDTGDRSRRLFVCNGRSDISRARQYAKKLLHQARRPELNLFLFIDQLDMEDGRNKAFDDVWQTANGPFVKLLQFHPLMGQKPAVQYQR